MPLREKPLKEGGEDIPLPPWDELEAERREEDPKVVTTIRDADGDRRPWQFLGNTRPVAGEPLLAFIRGGWSNPGMAEARSSLAYVEYRLEEGRLERRLLPRPDPTRETPESRMVLLEGVSELRLSYLGQGDGRERWQVPVDSRTEGVAAAIAIEADIAGLGRLRQLFLAPGKSS